ncbi:MAG: diaminohydroxyphosphoribosylaminopyrimidine deaminase [Actinomycetota bacterium]|jgi:diaminohydroxyphosphoribosylaminopyrimidine deaminase/5-amino-6-(5-phosphoribosylamino)uracil reductase|nr:diaminohydroxyphosphoribosylaminopyrimidine deaminase [Actinomycetota bacterium]
MTEVRDDGAEAKGRALDLAAAARLRAHPNPWVGAVLLPPFGKREYAIADSGFPNGSTAADGGAHAEVAALAEAGEAARGGTLYVTLEPCCAFEGKRTPACVQAIVEAGVAKVVVGLVDPDPRVNGRGIAALRAAGVEVEVDDEWGEQVAEQLAPYVHHRTTGRPYVVLKLASTLDGRTAAPDGTSQWITGDEARADAHRLRAESDAVLVGAGTVRADDPSLTVRHVEGRDPRRIVLGTAPKAAKVHPCDELDGPIEAVLDKLGAEGVVQLLVEGGAGVAGEFHRAGLVDRYVVYLAPVFAGGDDARGLFSGPGATTITGFTRGRIVEVTQLGNDLKVVVEA